MDLKVTLSVYFLFTGARNQPCANVLLGPSPNIIYYGSQQTKSVHGNDVNKEDDTLHLIISDCPTGSVRFVFFAMLFDCYTDSILTGAGESSSSRRPHTFTGSVMFADGDASSSVTSPGAPHFAELIRNVTVPLGREAVLSCVINNLAEYKVSLSDIYQSTCAGFSAASPSLLVYACLISPTCYPFAVICVYGNSYLKRTRARAVRLHFQIVHESALSAAGQSFASRVGKKKKGI